jgi:hypothetical protein
MLSSMKGEQRKWCKLPDSIAGSGRPGDFKNGGSETACNHMCWDSWRSQCFKRGSLGVYDPGIWYDVWETIELVLSLATMCSKRPSWAANNRTPIS